MGVFLVGDFLRLVLSKRDRISFCPLPKMLPPPVLNQEKNAISTTALDNKMKVFKVSLATMDRGVPADFSGSPTGLALFLPVSLWLFDFDEGSPAGSLVFLPPEVVGTRRPVHGPLDQTVEGLPADARAVALPPVLLVKGNLVVERVVNRDVGPSGLKCTISR